MRVRFMPVLLKSQLGARTRSFLLIVLVLGLAAPAARSQTIVNGSMNDGGSDHNSFNDRAPSGWSQYQANPMGADIFDVSTNSFGFAWQNSVDGGPFVHGISVLGLTIPFKDEGVTQTVTGLTPGHLCDVTFEQSMSDSDFALGAFGYWQVKLGNQTLNSTIMAVPPYGTPLAWTPETLTFSPTATSHDLSFVARSTLDLKRIEIGLDAVSISCAPAPGCGSDTLFIGTPIGQLGTVHLPTGVTTFLGNMGQGMVDIAHAPDGTLYGITFTQLYEIAGNGATTLIGTNIPSVNALVARSDGTLYAAGPNRLYIIDPTNAQVLQTIVTTVTPNGDIAFDKAGNLFMTAGSGGPPVLLVQLDPVTGATIHSGLTGFNDHEGADFDASGTLTAVADTGAIVALNTTPGPNFGVGTQIGSFSGPLTAAWGASAMCDPPVELTTQTPGVFCIDGLGNGSDWSWQFLSGVTTGPITNVLGLVSSSTKDLRDAFVSSIGTSIAGLTATDGPTDACFTLSYASGPFELWVGPPGDPSCPVSANPSGCSFNPQIYEWAYFPGWADIARVPSLGGKGVIALSSLMALAGTAMLALQRRSRKRSGISGPR